MKTKVTLILILALSAPISADASTKIIKLKDGSTIVGEIIRAEGGAYTVETDNLGQVTLRDENILSIQAEGAAAEIAPATDPSSLKQQVQSVQGQIVNDKAIMGSINALANDKEIQALMQNQQLMDTIMSFDAQRIENDPAVKELLQRKDVQAIMRQVESKINSGGK